MDIRDLAFIESHYVKVMFYPRAWDDAQDFDLVWDNIDFPPMPRALIPKSPGVYAFIVEPNLFSLEPANGLFYVGKATNLYQRIGAYMSELTKDFSVSTRPRIWKMLNQWRGRFKYYYTITDTVAEAEQLEKVMLEALRPPFNKQYEAETSQIMRAFQ
ncbi:GIY-YIG nuclease family protein [Pseudoalteromonas sp. NZS37]|uniref:GIY-YIG nuclease family protein n=1 Tax=Pseudoalteromonas sp. NZS37 TaxID=2792071 RepID=UPI0018CD7651|nr:GIY-YIG nuclease family protein [Pseudoalteromonas sp. NZS37]MBG9989650.1 GIY-YIG nuclease family protein [Pseudoalteromonas sp. NZS37]